MENIPIFEAKTQEKKEQKEEKVLRGCIVSLREMIPLLENLNEEQEKIKVVKDLLSIAEESNGYKNLSIDFITKIKYATLVAIEMLFIDEMAKNVDRSGLQSLLKRKYGRDFPPVTEGDFETEDGNSNACVSYIFLDAPVLEDDIAAMVSTGKVPEMGVGAYKGRNLDDNLNEKNARLLFHVIDNPSDLEKEAVNQNMKFIVISKVIENYEENEKLNELIREAFKNPAIKNIIVMGLKLTDKVGVLQVFESNDISLRSSIFTKRSLPIQEKILAMLESGISFLTHGKLEDAQDAQSQRAAKVFNIENLNKKLDDCIYSFSRLEKNVSDRYYRRKMMSFVQNKNEENYMKRHEEHYREFFSVGERRPDEIVFTRSGLSANNSATRALGEIMPENTKAYFQSGWYYENEKIIIETFEEVSKIKEAKVLFISVDSCYPDDSIKFHQEQKKLLDEFLKKARKDKENQYALVVDVTSNLLWGNDIEIPKNLIFLKTFSLSKHQRGSHNYFFGGIASWNSSRSLKRNSLHETGEHLMTTGVINYPRLRKSEIEKNMQHLKILTKFFMNGLKEGQSELSEKDRLLVYPYNYYTYITFPYKLKEEPILDDMPSEQELRWSFGSLAEPGDSFGLDQTRVCYVPRSPRDRRLSLRFCLGIKENKERAYELGFDIAEKWKDLLEKQKSVKKNSG